jgi:excisionase family DNA binding protein
VLLRLKDAAARLALSASRLYEMVAAGEIGHHRLGGAIRISEIQIAEYLEQTKRERRERPDKSQPRRPRLRIRL